VSHETKRMTFPDLSLISAAQYTLSGLTVDSHRERDMIRKPMNKSTNQVPPYVQTNNKKTCKYSQDYCDVNCTDCTTAELLYGKCNFVNKRVR